ncbi:hypothetical protein H5203_21880 [Pseudoalteromonas sp. SG41-1]|uniref:hypothetical protein n=1 Tax=Pseudoalteromonas sp. SG41-1 TaxID=2760979 RepID=UPI0016008620|nr:hypothetical protein [Pseudoalteromonas sp. SG41-1]MBB1508089.1 hypothetical protein [Pseudoalteromonas sp. SG41-1]
MIFIPQQRQQNFFDDNHVKNFSNYLFSKSKKHKENEDTKKNIVCYKNENGSFFTRNVFDPSEELKAFNNHFKKLNLKSKELYNDLAYVFFLLEIDDVFYTNMFYIENNDFLFDMPQEIAEYFIESNFKGDVRLFNKELNKIIGDKDFYTIKEASPEIMRKLNGIIFKHLKINHNMILAIGHVDQEDFYHVHRIMKK